MSPTQYLTHAFVLAIRWGCIDSMVASHSSYNANAGLH